jgi:hypothetical protein
LMVDCHSMRMRAKLIVALEPWRVPSSSRVLEGGEPARIVAVKKSVNGFLSGTGTELLAKPSGRISSRRFSEIDLPLAFEPLTWLFPSSVLACLGKLHILPAAARCAATVFTKWSA